ncbi:nuclear transport factor 2 family protein [Noviherbaspirillum malthae]|uniref:nuclear transport factor 2 family protein n=1 Tax=Noviherbaspirillum malthae TaxID=1260987 RepID=UPI0018907DE0|nr:nuclear transport factor 2 family protein [Noviherbaspirillum malthae]
MIHFPAPIAAYLEAANANDTRALAACFTADALVHDEAREYRGIEAILAWKAETSTRYRPIVEALHIEGADRDYRLQARVTGDFPGSPAMLAYRFVLSGDCIASLEVGV